MLLRSHCSSYLICHRSILWQLIAARSESSGPEKTRLAITQKDFRLSTEKTEDSQHFFPFFNSTEPCPRRSSSRSACLASMGTSSPRERVRASLETWPETSAEVEWPPIQQKLQDFCRKRGWHCTVKFHNGTELEDLCDPSSLRRLLEAQHETLLRESVELRLYLFSDPTSGTS